MGVQYDEYLEDNPFFREIQKSHKDILEKASSDNLIICIPRAATIQTTLITPTNILQHVLKENDGDTKNSYTTLSGKVVDVSNGVLVVRNEPDCCNKIQILFQETFYLDNLKFKLWCIDGPLNQAFAINDPSDLTNIVNIRDCIHLLSAEAGGDVLERINVVIRNFIEKFPNLHKVTEDALRIIAKTLFVECVDTVLKDDELGEKVKSDKLLLDKFQLATETYMQYCLGDYIFSAICTTTAREDAELNKKIRNLHELQLKDFPIPPKIYDKIPAAKFELNCINKHFTTLSKINCLKNTFYALSRRENGYPLNTDNLLLIFLFLLVKVNINNWLGNLKYLISFRFSNLDGSDETSFLITTLEAAVEFLRTRDLKEEFELSSGRSFMEFELAVEDTNRSLLRDIFKEIREGNLEGLKELYKPKPSDHGAKQVTSKKCHPLCSCDACEKITRKEKFCTVNSTDERGRNTLHIACIYGNPDIVDFLINCDSDVDATDSSASSPLHYAVLRGHQHAALLLLHAGANINCMDLEGNTPLHLACNNGHECCVKALIYYSENNTNKIDINCTNKSGNTPLHLASRWGYVKIVQVLLQFNAFVNIRNKSGLNPWDVAHSIYVKKELSHAEKEQKRQSNKKGNTVELEENHQTPSTSDQQPIVTEQHLNMGLEVEEVYENMDGHKFGVRPKNIEEAKKCSLLLKAIEINDMHLTRYYLGMHPDLESSESDKSFDCHPLCNCEKCKVVTEVEATSLSQERININMCNLEGYTALHTAAKFGRLKILRLLLDSGALITIETYKTRFNVLHIASFYNHLNIIKEILKCGEANIDVQDSYGNTPLHYSAMMGSDDIVDFLLKHGANQTLKNIENKTPYDEAKEHIRNSTAKILKMHQQREFAHTLQSTYLD